MKPICSKNDSRCIKRQLVRKMLAVRITICACVVTRVDIYYSCHPHVTLSNQWQVGETSRSER